MIVIIFAMKREAHADSTPSALEYRMIRVT
jgi:hypothetical protein